MQQKTTISPPTKLYYINKHMNAIYKQQKANLYRKLFLIIYRAFSPDLPIQILYTHAHTDKHTLRHIIKMLFILWFIQIFYL